MVFSELVIDVSCRRINMDAPVFLYKQ